MVGNCSTTKKSAPAFVFPVAHPRVKGGNVDLCLKGSAARNGAVQPSVISCREEPVLNFQLPWWEDKNVKVYVEASAFLVICW